MSIFDCFSIIPYIAYLSLQTHNGFMAGVRFGFAECGLGRQSPPRAILVQVKSVYLPSAPQIKGTLKVVKNELVIFISESLLNLLSWLSGHCSRH